MNDNPPLSSIPTVSQVTSWQLGVLAEQGTYWTQQAGKLKTELDTVNNNVGNSGDYIVGKFGNALRDKTLTVRDEGYKVAGALEDAGSAVTGGIAPMQAAQKAVIDQKAIITGQGFMLAEDGGVVLSLSQVANALSDSKNGATKLAALQRSADDFQTWMRTYLYNAGDAAQTVATAITKAFGELPNSIDGAAPVPITAASGEDLGKKIKDSDQIPPDVISKVDQVLDQTQLSDEDKAKLKTGDTVVVPASTLEFTQKLLDSAGPEGFEKLSEQLRAQGPDGEKRAQELAQSFMVLSNQNIKGVEASGKQIDGGYETLPQPYRDIISNRVVEQPGSQPGMPGYIWDGNSFKYENPKGESEIQAGRDHYQNLARLSSALDLADPSYTPGTKLSTELYRQGAFLSEIQTDGRTAALPHDPAALNSTIGKVVDIASRNTDATSIILTGQGSPDQLGSGYHRDPAVMALLEHDWPDGIDKSPMKNVTDWMWKDAHVNLSPGDEGYQHQVAEATKAGNSARALADIISTTKSPEGLDNFDTLFNHKSQALPYVAAALTPYVGNMVNVPENLVNTHGFGTLNPVEATRVFALMNQDPKAAELLNGAAIAQAYQFDREYALGQGGEENALYSGRLQGLVTGGQAAEIGLTHNADQTDASHRKDGYGAGFMTAKEWINTGIKLLPGDKYTVPLANSIEAFLKDPTVNAINDKPGLSYPVLEIQKPDGHSGDPDFGLTQERRDAAQRYVMLQALVDNHRISPDVLPDSLANSNGLLPFDQVNDTDIIHTKTILQNNGINLDVEDYINHSSTASQVVRDVVFGGARVQPGSDLYISVLQATKAPAAADRWDAR